jgi:MFS family permease
MQSETPRALIEKREIHATLGAALFTNGVWDMLGVVVPLYGVAAGLSAAEIGFVVAARSVLPTALSIHGGILMDQWGTRRVLRWVGVASTVLPLVYPIAGLFTVLLLLQLLLGLSSSLGMSAGQTWNLQSSHGDTAKLAYFSLVSRIGTFLGPVMVGAIWDAFGAWAAFASISLWASGIVASAAYGAPAVADQGKPASTTRLTASRSIGALLPRWSEHKNALALAAIPAVAFVLGVSFFRNAPGAIQASLYVVYLGDLGMSGTVIGTLVALCELFGVLGSLLAAPLERAMRAHWLVIACITTSVLAIAATPLIGRVFGLLVVAAAVRGIGQGLSQPLVYSILGRAVPAAAHGASVGLRNAVTRLASIITPAVMGIAAEAWGIEVSFYVVGAALLVGTAALAVFARSSISTHASMAQRLGS